MKQRARKLIGVTLCVAFIIVYSLVAMVIGASHFVEVSGWVQGLYYVVAGLLWLPVPMALIVWMQRPD